ncbi:MAG: hypothetical protein AABW45_01980 [Nanoarchaeota archaeon]
MSIELAIRNEEFDTVLIYQNKVLGCLEAVYKSKSPEIFNLVQSDSYIRYTFNKENSDEVRNRVQTFMRKIQPLRK